MSYLANEQSAHGSEPVELYEFTRGVRRYTYTSNAKDILFTSVIFTATPMERSSLESSGELGRAGIKVTMPRDIAFVSEYLVSPPSEVTTLTIYRKHRGAPDSEAIVIWMGRMLNLTWENSTVELLCEPVFTSIRRLGLRKQYSRSCSHVLYGPKCSVNNTAFKYEGLVIGISANTVSVAGIDSNGDNYYAGGYMEWDYQGRVEKKMILRQIGPTLTLGGFPIGLLGGVTVKVFPGCDHSLATCSAKYNNKLNYGGFPWIPSKNPFSSIALW